MSVSLSKPLPFIMPLTCITCKLLFSVPEQYREHYKSDWHRYNIKRKICVLPPITKCEYEERAAAFEACSKETEKVSLKCSSCNKHFSSRNAMSNHIRSKKHVENSSTKPKAKKVIENASNEEWSDSDWESMDEEDYSSSDFQKENFEEDAITDLLNESEFELVLPSGVTVGHRSLALYYKQNLKPVSSFNAKNGKILQYCKSLGYTGATGCASVKKVRDIVLMQRIKSRYNLKLSVKNNKMQPHFRNQIMF